MRGSQLQPGSAVGCREQIEAQRLQQIAHHLQVLRIVIDQSEC